MPQLDYSTYPSQLFWLVLSFALLYAIMARFLLPKIADTVQARQTRISQDLERANDLRLEAEQARRDYEAKLAESRVEANQLIQEAIDHIKKTQEDRHSRLDNQLRRQMKETEERIAGQRAAALHELESSAMALTQEIVTKMIGKKPSSNDIKPEAKLS